MPKQPRPFYWFEHLFWSVYSYTWDDPLRTTWGRKRIQMRVDWLASCRQHDCERVLDLGCGTGNYLIALTAAGYEVVGLDFASGMLEKAQAKAASLPQPHPAIALKQADLNQELPFPNGSFDNVLCILALQCVVDPQGILLEIHRVLKPGGLLLIAVPSPDAQVAAPTEASLSRILLWKLKSLASRSSRVHSFAHDELVELLVHTGFEVVEERLQPSTIELLARAPRPQTENAAGAVPAA